MKIDILTLFPEIFKNVLNISIIGRAIEAQIFEIQYHQIRDFSDDKHHTVDDKPFGGGQGMLLRAEPLARCFENLCAMRKCRPYLIYMSPKGAVLSQKILKKISDEHESIAILCGHYEGVDERFLEQFVDEEISIGDYVLSGGELPALVFVESLCRLIPGVLSQSRCFQDESHFEGLLEYPQYTRPQVWRGHAVPEVLVSGHHEKIEEWKRKKSLELTANLRPDLFKKFSESHFLELDFDTNANK